MTDSLEADASQTFTIDVSGDENSIRTTVLPASNFPEPVKRQIGKKAAPIKRYLV